MCTSRRKTSVFRVKTRGKRFGAVCVRLYACTDKMELSPLFSDSAFPLKNLPHLLGGLDADIAPDPAAAFEIDVVGGIVIE